MFGSRFKLSQVEFRTQNKKESQANRSGNRLRPTNDRLPFLYDNDF